MTIAARLMKIATCVIAVITLVTVTVLDRVDFIKMDIEGAEVQALEGAANTVARFRPRMAVSTEHQRTDPDTIPGVVHRLWPQAIAEYGPYAPAAGRISPTCSLCIEWPLRPLTAPPPHRTQEAHSRPCRHCVGSRS